MTAKDRTWAEISLENIKYNYASIKSRLSSGVELLGVVKADAYGHGAVPVAHAIVSAGCKYLAVATDCEALELRRAGISSEIIILGYTSPGSTESLIENNIIQSVSDYETARLMSDLAVKLGKKLRIHIKMDTGMGRLGFTFRGGVFDTDSALRVIKLPGLSPEGIFTHFAVSEVISSDYTDRQFEAFISGIDELERKSGIKFKVRHCSNSGAVCSHGNMQLDMVRPGILLYGLYPGDDRNIPLRPAMQLKTRIIHISEAEPGWSISYGRKYTAETKRKIAVVPIGYADGLHRVLSGKIDMLVNGRRVPQVGNICMDMCMIDVTDAGDVAIGDVVTVFGSDEAENISAEELAEKAGTIHYELLCAVSKRIPRVYI